MKRAERQRLKEKLSYEKCRACRMRCLTYLRSARNIVCLYCDARGPAAFQEIE